MVELKLTGKCAGCPCFDTDVRKLYSGGVCVETVVICANQDLCDHLEQHLKEALTNGEEEV